MAALDLRRFCSLSIDILVDIVDNNRVAAGALLGLGRSLIGGRRLAIPIHQRQMGQRVVATGHSRRRDRSNLVSHVGKRIGARARRVRSWTRYGGGRATSGSCYSRAGRARGKKQHLRASLKLVRHHEFP